MGESAQPSVPSAPPEHQQAEIGWIPAKLPSRGVLYEDRIPDGVVQIRKLTAREESILASQGSEGLERMNLIVKNCVKLPNGYLHDDLLMTDRMALLLALRTVTFGTYYTYTYKCSFCNMTAKAGIDIQEDLDESTPEVIAMKQVEKGRIESPDEFLLEEPLTVDLPDNGKTLTLRFLRGSDEDRVAKRAKRLRMQSNDVNDLSYIHRIALQIITIDGEKENLAMRELFVKQLTSKDTSTIRIHVDELEPGIDLRVYPTCRGCGGTNELAMPFGGEFFQPTTL